MKYEVEILFDYAEWALCPYNDIERVYLKQDLSCSSLMYISEDGRPISSLTCIIGDGLRKLEDWQKNICDHFEKENKENTLYMLKDGHIMIIAKDGSRTIIPKTASENYIPDNPKKY